MSRSIAKLAGVAVCSIGLMVNVEFVARAQESPTPAEQTQFKRCDAMAALLVEKLALTLDRISPLQHNIFFQKVGGKEVTLMCGYDAMGFTVGVDNAAFPPAPVFALAAAGGALVTGEQQNRILAGLRKCHRAALRDASEISDDIAIGRAKLECHAFTRDGGGSILDVWQAAP